MVVDYAPLTAVADADAAIAPRRALLSTRRSPATCSSPAAPRRGDVDGAFARAAVAHLPRRVQPRRVSASPLEPRGLVASLGGRPPHRVDRAPRSRIIDRRRASPAAFGLHGESRAPSCPDTGGGFGQKMHRACLRTWPSRPGAGGTAARWRGWRRAEENLAAASQAPGGAGREMEAGADGQRACSSLRARVCSDARRLSDLSARPGARAPGHGQYLPGAVPHPSLCMACGGRAANEAAARAPIAGVGHDHGRRSPWTRTLDLLAARLGRRPGRDPPPQPHPARRAIPSPPASGSSTTAATFPPRSPMRWSPGPVRGAARGSEARPDGPGSAMGRRGHLLLHGVHRHRVEGPIGTGHDGRCRGRRGSDRLQ